MSCRSAVLGGCVQGVRCEAWVYEPSEATRRVMDRSRYGHWRACLCLLCARGKPYWTPVALEGSRNVTWGRAQQRRVHAPIYLWSALYAPSATGSAAAAAAVLAALAAAALTNVPLLPCRVALAAALPAFGAQQCTRALHTLSCFAAFGAQLSSHAPCTTLPQAAASPDHGAWPWIAEGYG